MDVLFNPSYNIVQNRNNVQFKGRLGDEIVKEITQGAGVKPEVVIKKIKGTFGSVKTDRAEDIFGSLIATVKNFFDEKNILTIRLSDAESRIRRFPQEKENAISDAENKLRKSFQEALRAKDIELAQKERELKAAKEFAAKYEPMTRVKSIEEISTVMPEQAKTLLNELVANKTVARKSMEDFLFSGKGQEEAMKQVNRVATLHTAYCDGVFKIPEINALAENIRKEENIFPYTTPLTALQNIIENTLLGSEKGNYIVSKSIREQVKKNAMALLTPHTDNNYSNTTVSAVEKDLDKMFERVEKFHKGFALGLEKYKKRLNGEIEINKVEYDIYKSRILFKEDPNYEQKTPITFWQVSNFGNSNWS